MATILKRKMTSADTDADILEAAHTLAADKHTRVMLDDQCDWQATKLKEIARLVNIVRKRAKARAAHA